MADWLLVTWVIVSMAVGTLLMLLGIGGFVLFVAEKLWFATCVTVMECRYSVKPLTCWARLRVWVWHINDVIKRDREFGRCKSMQVGRWVVDRPFGLPREYKRNAD